MNDDSLEKDRLEKDLLANSNMLNNHPSSHMNSQLLKITPIQTPTNGT